MGKDTDIQWCTHTFNPWRGCTKVSPGCAKCYAEAAAKRNPKVLGVWGDGGTRVVAAEAGWNEVLKWDRKAKESGERHRVFCASFADVFEDWQGQVVTSKGLPYWWCGGSLSNSPVPSTFEAEPSYRYATLGDMRERLFQTIDDTPDLDWLLLTKRPENVLRMTYDAWCRKVPGHVSQNEGDGRAWNWPANVWLGTTVENQEEADKRIPILLNTPAKVRFLSMEPLLGPVDLGRYFGPQNEGQWLNVVECGHESNRYGINWVIVGGESGSNARPCDLAWIRSIVAQCKAAGVACFVKQMGSHIITRNDELSEWPEPFGHDESERYQGAPIRVRLRDSHGGDPSEWPADVRVREFPGVKVMA